VSDSNSGPTKIWARFNTRSAAIVFTLLLSVVGIQASAILWNRFPDFELSTALLVILLAYVIRRHGLLSVPSLFGALLVYPLLIPVASTYLFDVPLYALRGKQFQSPGTTNRVLFYGVLAMASFIAGLEFSRLRRSSSSNWMQRLSAYEFYYHSRAFWVIAAVCLVSAYLTTPGPTLLTVDYVTVTNNYYSWATFAGSLFVGTWIVLFLMIRSHAYSSKEYRLFFLVTSVALVWLLLHARRNETLGVMAVLAVDAFRSRFEVGKLFRSWRSTVAVSAVAVLGFGQVLIEEYRNSGELRLPTYGTGVHISYPGGAHNIYGTFQATVSLFTHEHGLWYGESFLKLVVQSLPGVFFGTFGLPYPEAFWTFLGSEYQLYLGGSYILNIYFANFGILGVIMCGLVLAALVAFAKNMIGDLNSTHLGTGLAAAVIAGSTRALWYTQLAWVDHSQGLLLATALYLMVVNSSRAAVGLSRDDDP